MAAPSDIYMASALVVTGNGDPLAGGTVEQIGWTRTDQTYRFTQQAGWQVAETWQGPKEWLADFLKFVNPLVDEISFQDNGPLYSLNVSISLGEASAGTGIGPPTANAKDPVAYQWGIVANTIQRSILELPKVRGTYTAAEYSANVAAVRAQIQAWEATIENATDPAAVDLNDFRDACPAGPAGDPDLWKDVFDRLVNNDDMVELSQYVLRLQQELATKSALTARHDNVNRILTKAYLLQEETDLTNAAVLSINTLNVPFWFKRAPQVEGIANGKVMVSQEYWGFESFDAWRYGDAVDVAP